MTSEEYIQEKIRFIKTYKGVGTRDFSEIDRLNKRIRKTPYKATVRDLNMQIDLDFIKENEEIENVSEKELKDRSDFLRHPATRITRDIPIESIFVESLTGEDYLREKEEVCKKTYITATNAVLKRQMPLQYNKHLFALAKLFKKADQEKRKIHKGKSIQGLSHYDILDTNELLFKDTPQEGMHAIGRYRSPYDAGFTMVRGGKTQPVDNGRVSDYMDAILKWYNDEDTSNLHPIEKAMILHTEFVRVHPFGDGNGRTARLLMGYELVKSGYPTLVIKAKDKRKYLEALDVALQEHDIGPLVDLANGYMQKIEKKYITTINNIKNTEKGKE